MTESYLEYELHDGYIHNWLVAGPVEFEVEGPSSPEQSEHERKLEIAEEIYREEPGIEGAPAERETVEIEGEEIQWAYVRTPDDHFIDLSTFRHRWTALRAWAYTELDCFEAQTATFELTTNGPADVWINGAHIHGQRHFHHQMPHRVTFEADLQEGGNAILVRFEEVAARECPYAMALRVENVPEPDVEVRVPSATERVARHLMLEKVFPQAYLEEETSYRGRGLTLHWAEDLEARFNYQYTVQDPDGHVHISGKMEAQPGVQLDIGHDFRIWQGPYRVVLRSRPEDYYYNNIRYEWEIPFFILDNEYSETPYGTYEERNRELLEYAAWTKASNLYGEIAKFELRRWDEIDLDVIRDAIDRINRRGDCSDFDLVGLLGVMHRTMDEEGFPESLKEPLKSCVLNFKYWHDEPGSDAMCFTTENHSILFHTCEILAGQLYPDEVFSNVGETGAWHQEKGERLARAWLKTRGATGFREWDSNCYFEEDLLALSHLAGLAENEEIMELASVVIDKMLFTMAVNSYKGTFGSTHGRTYAPLIKSGKLESTSSISRLMWGMGVFNHHLRGAVSMACSEYEFPLLLANIAADLPDAMWNRERHVISEDGDEINKVTYKTPDYMLASAQDYHPGERGYQQHIWQATFGPDAVVFVNHPPCISEEGAHRPNFWSGNVVLPRVAQWKDVLFGLHRLDEDDWLGFTHAYFPVYAMHEFAFRGGWAFARVGEGYLALTASQGIALVRRGPAAYRELRSYGRENVWVCQMGRADQDGDFDDFQRKVLQTELSFEGLDVAYTSLRGEALTFGWDRSLTRDGEVQPITGFKHYENPYCTVDLPAEEMDIQFDEYVLRLKF